MNTLVNNGTVDLDNIHADDLAVVGIAKALCRITRFCGNFDNPMSVAQHAVLVTQVVAKLGGDTLEQLAALHHDDSEALLGDVPSTVKSYCMDYQMLESRVMDSVDQLYGIDTRSEMVREADREVGLAELMFHSKMDPSLPRIMTRVTVPRFNLSHAVLLPWTYEESLSHFLDLHENLLRKIADEDDDDDALPPITGEKEILN